MHSAAPAHGPERRIHHAGPNLSGDIPDHFRSPALQVHRLRGNLDSGVVPRKRAWLVWFAGVALIAGGIGLLVPRTARLAGLLSGMMVPSWFWIVHIPRTFVSVSDGIALFEALAFSSIGFVIAGFRSENVRSG